MFDLASVAPGLERRDPGIWFARRQAEVSYPALGNAAYLEVEDQSFWFRHRNRCVVNLVRRYPPEGVFLDIGGGNGFVARGLIVAGFACALLEPGIDGALAAHARGVDPVICARIEDTDLAAGSFSAAGMFDVLEHIEDESAALLRVHRLLSPRGRLFVTVPAYQFLYSVDDETAGHFRRYTISSLSHVLRRCGFRIGFASYIFAPLPPVLFLFRTVPSRLGLRREAPLNRVAMDHATAGIAARSMDCLLAAESKWLDSGRPLPFGGTCLCVAVKE